MVKDIKSNNYNVIAVYGSPRRDGNTDTVLNTFLEGLLINNYFFNNKVNLKIDKFILSNLKFSPCRECRHCSIDGECIINDDIQAIYPKMVSANLILIASPIFFTNVSGYLKAFIDRFQRFWALKYELKKQISIVNNKKGVFLSCAGSSNPSIFDCAKKVIRSLFDVLYTDYLKDFCFNNIDQIGDVKNNKLLLKDVFEFAKSLVLV